MTAIAPSGSRIPSHQDIYGLGGRVSGLQSEIEASLLALTEMGDLLNAAAGMLLDALRSGGKVLVMGNGGSAAEAQHFVAELMGRFCLDRAPFAVVALTADTAVLTAIGNDYGFEEVFSRQVAGLAGPSDVLVAFSTSGASRNVIRAAETAQDLGCKVLALTGGRPNRLSELANIGINVPAQEPCRVQELHMILTHLLCEVVERELSLPAYIHRGSEDTGVRQV